MSKSPKHLNQAQGKIPKLLSTDYSLFSTPKIGMTLVEIMVSLVILMMVLGAVFSILNIQQTRASQVSKTTLLQTDAQVAFTLIKWDLLLAGLGYPFKNQDAVQLTGAGGDVSLKAVGLGFEMSRVHWSYLIDMIDGPEILIRRWPDSLANFTSGDTIVILNEMRDPMYDNLVINNDPQTDTFTFVDSLWGDSIPAAKLNVGISISARAGLLVFRKHGNVYGIGLTYLLSGDTLKRGNEALLNNVEAIQFRYGIDTDGDNIIDSWGNNNNPPFNAGYNKKWAIRFTMVVNSSVMPGYKYPYSTVTIEDNPPYTYTLTLDQRRRKRAILSGIIYPQNLQPEEDL